MDELRVYVSDCESAFFSHGTQIDTQGGNVTNMWYREITNIHRNKFQLFKWLRMPNAKELSP